MTAAGIIHTCDTHYRGIRRDPDGRLYEVYQCTFCKKEFKVPAVIVDAITP